MSDNAVALSPESARTVLEALDVCVRTNGLRAAAALLPIAQDIDAQLTRIAQPPAEP